MIVDPLDGVERAAAGEEGGRPKRARASGCARVPRQRERETERDGDRVSRDQHLAFEASLQPPARVCEHDLDEERGCEGATDQPQRREQRDGQISPIPEEPDPGRRHHQRPDHVPGSPVERHDPRGEVRDPHDGIQEVVLLHALVDADPLAAQHPEECEGSESGERPPAARHRVPPPSTASSAPADSSAFEMNPRAPLRSIPLP